MMPRIPTHLEVTRGAAIGVLVSWAAILALSIWLVHQNSRLADQRAATQRLSLQNCRSQNILRDVVTGLLYNQSNLDRRFVTILGNELNEIPERCP